MANSQINWLLSLRPILGELGAEIDHEVSEGRRPIQASRKDWSGIHFVHAVVSTSIPPSGSTRL